MAFGFVLGLSLAGPPGPMNALIASESVRAWRRGAVTGLGAMSADAVLGAVVYAVGSAFGLREFVRAIYVIGAVVTAAFGVRLLARRAEEPTREVPPVRTYTAALAMGLSNPFQILWWLTSGLAFAYLGGAPLFLGLFGAIAAWIVAFPWVVHRGTRKAPSAGRWVARASGAIMLAFAAYFVFLAL